MNKLLPFLLIALVCGCAATNAIHNPSYDLSYSREIREQYEPRGEELRTAYFQCIYFNHLANLTIAIRRGVDPVDQNTSLSACNDQEREYYSYVFYTSFPGRENSVRNEFRHNTARISTQNTRRSAIQSAQRSAREYEEQRR